MFSVFPRQQLSYAGSPLLQDPGARQRFSRGQVVVLKESAPAKSWLVPMAMSARPIPRDGPSPRSARL